MSDNSTNGTDNWSRVTDRDEYAEIAEDYMGETKYEKPGPSKISTPELVDTMRSTEDVVANLLDQNDVTSDFCEGFYTAMAAIRHDFGVRDSSHAVVGGGE